MENEKYCGKCYKLDRINDKCERYHAPLVKRKSLGFFPVYEKCAACLLLHGKEELKRYDGE
jgi:hypothetical protein